MVISSGDRALTQRCLGMFCFSMAAFIFLAQAANAQDAIWRSYYSAAQKEYQRGDLGEAESLLTTALNSTNKTDESLSTYYYLAHVCEKREHFEDAIRYYRVVLDGLGTKTWAVLRPPDGTPDWEQRPENVEQTADSAEFYAVLKKKPPQLLSIKLAKPITIVDVLADFGTLMQVTKRYNDAETAYRQALILSDCRPDQATNYEVRLLQKLSVLYEIEGRAPEHDAVSQQLAIARNASLPDFDRVISDTIKGLDRFGRDPHSQAIRLNNLALFCATHGDYAKAQSLFNRAVSCLNEHPNRHKRDRAIVLGNYSDLLLAMGRVTEATNINREVTSLGNVVPAQTANKSSGY